MFEPHIQTDLMHHLPTVYDVSGAASDRNCVVLNDIHIDIMDYIVPATCTDTEFRQMWAEFEWENKVAVNTNIKDLHEYMEHLINTTNMKCLTPEKVGCPELCIEENLDKKMRGRDTESRRIMLEHTEKLKVGLTKGKDSFKVRWCLWLFVMSLDL